MDDMEDILRGFTEFLEKHALEFTEDGLAYWNEEKLKKLGIDSGSFAIHTPGCDGDLSNPCCAEYLELLPVYRAIQYLLEDKT